MAKGAGKGGRRLYKEWGAEDIVAAIDEWERRNGMPHDSVHGTMNVDQLRRTFLVHVKNQKRLSQGYELLHYGERKLFGIDYEAVRNWYRTPSKERHARVRSMGAGSGERHLAANNATAKRNKEKAKHYSSGGVTSNSAGVRPYVQKFGGWTLSEVEAVRCAYPSIGLDRTYWREHLPGRSIDEIYEQARKMGLRFTEAKAHTGESVTAGAKQPGHKANSAVQSQRPSRGKDSIAPKGTTMQTPTRSAKPKRDEAQERRMAWAVDLVEAYYDTYGWHWDQWRRVVPWMKGRELRELASELGHAERWSDASKRSFLSNEGLDWTLDELDSLILGYPLRPDTSIDWEVDLPKRSAAERRELAELLGLPTKAEMTDLARRARLL